MTAPTCSSTSTGHSPSVRSRTACPRRHSTLHRKATTRNVPAWVAYAFVPETPSRRLSRFDELISTHRDLRQGRFVVIADFERPEHFSIFDLDSASREARLEPQRGGPHARTGDHALGVTLSAPADQVVIASADRSEWILKRDWQPYPLLLMSVQCSAPHAALGVELVSDSGAGENRSAIDIPLRSGWNDLRIDLAAAGRRVPLDNVREVRLRVDAPRYPVQCTIDDVILADNRAVLIGDPSARDGGLYVERVGRRWRIGAIGGDIDFEIVFEQGRITGLYQPGRDENRTANLIGGVLGPTPITHAAAEGVRETAAGRLAVETRIVEMSRVRVLLESRWEPLVTGPTESALLHRRWQYAVYPTGQIWFLAEATAAGEGLANWVATLTSPDRPESPIFCFAPGRDPGATLKPAAAMVAWRLRTGERWLGLFETKELPEIEPTGAGFELQIPPTESTARTARWRGVFSLPQPQVDTDAIAQTFAGLGLDRIRFRQGRAELPGDAADDRTGGKISTKASSSGSCGCQLAPGERAASLKRLTASTSAGRRARRA